MLLVVTVPRHYQVYVLMELAKMSGILHVVEHA